MMDERERESEDERESNVSGIIMDAFCGGFGVALLLLQLDASPHIILHVGEEDRGCSCCFPSSRFPFCPDQTAGCIICTRTPNLLAYQPDGVYSSASASASA